MDQSTSLGTYGAAAQITRVNVDEWKTWTGQLGQPATITYGYVDTGGDWRQFSGEEIATTEDALQLWADLANITFTRLGGEGNANIDFLDYDAEGKSGGNTETTYRLKTPHQLIQATSGLNLHDSFDPDSNSYDISGMNFSQGGEQRRALIHEIGHALGLKHPGNYDADDGQDHVAGYLEDSKQYSVMSYIDEGNTGAVWGGASARTPMLHDIAAIQLLYGANYNTRTGNTVYGFNSNADREAFHIYDNTEKAVFTIWDGDGIDTLDASGYFGKQVINLSMGWYSDIGGLKQNIAIAMGTVIENAVGGHGSDEINGNYDSNNIHGGDGRDSIYGSLGNDFLYGDGDNDHLYGEDDSDLLDGGSGDDSLDGGANVDTLFGEKGKDTLDGGTGADRMYGGAGSDTYYFDDAGDRAFENATDFDPETGRWLSGGTDTIISSVDVQLPDQVENLQLFGYAGIGTGNELGNVITGNDYTNLLSGNGGNDTINGGGGDDFIYGGAGEDTLNGEARDDIIYGGDNNDTVDGGSGKDTIYGEAGNDTLDGGESGNDTIYGGEGDDTVIVRLTGNTDTVYGEGGSDTLSFALATGADHVDLDLSKGSQSFGSVLGSITYSGFENVVGTQGADHLVGDGLNNRLDGNGGSDTLEGGEGNDTLVVGRVGDQIAIGGGGFDTLSFEGTAKPVTIQLFSGNGSQTFMDGLRKVGSVKFTGIENLTGGSGGDKLIGDNNANILDGGRGSDTIYGGGGNDTIEAYWGNDTIYGGADSDTLAFTHAPRAVDVSLAAGHATFMQGQQQVGTATFYEMENLQGSQYGDKLTGDGNANDLDGREGNDQIFGMGGDDRIAVSIFDNDTVDGGADHDTLMVSDFLYETTIDLAKTTQTFNLGGIQLGTVTYTSIENLWGNFGKDTFYGNEQENVLTGNFGNDVLDGRAGNDKLDGGAGEDILQGGLGADEMIGGDNNDTYYVDNVDDKVTEGDGTNAGVDLVYSSSTDYTLAPNVENLTLLDGAIGGTGNALANTISGNDQANQLFGMGDADTIEGNGGADTLDGGAGDDILRGGDGADALHGGDDTDTADYSLAMDSIIVDLANGGSGGEAAGDTYNSIEVVVGSEYADILRGTAGDDVLKGIGDSDILEGRGGNDTLTGGDADYANTFVYARGWDNDVITDFKVGMDHLDMRGVTGLNSMGGLSITDTAEGAKIALGVDTITLNGVTSAQLTAADFLFTQTIGRTFDGTASWGQAITGTDGIDTLTYSTQKAGVYVDLVRDGGFSELAQIEPDGSRLHGHMTGIENVTGATDYMNGLLGDDQDNILTGGNSGNWFDGRGGNNTLIGGASIDYADYADSPGPVTIDLSVGKAYHDGYVDTLVSIESFRGSYHSDTFIGSNGNDYYNDLGGHDTIYGNGGDDVLDGYAGDTIDGGAGRDRLGASSGDDFLTGGSDADTFVFRDGSLGRHEITDLNIYEGDHISFSDYTVPLNLRFGDDSHGNAMITYATRFGDATIVLDHVEANALHGHPEWFIS